MYTSGLITRFVELIWTYLCLILQYLFYYSVLERPSSQISFLEHFLNNTSLSTTTGNSSVVNDYHRMAASGSVESEEGDIEDNRIPSAESSKSNLSELSNVSGSK